MEHEKNAAVAVLQTKYKPLALPHGCPELTCFLKKARPEVFLNPRLYVGLGGARVQRLQGFRHPSKTFAKQLNVHTG